jgi:MFS family permease
LADIYGARPLFILGAALFALGSLLSAIAPDFYSLLGARIIQGAGGAAAPGLGMTLASRAYGPASRGTVLGVIGATIGIGAAIGPPLGGALPSIWGWEAIFVLNAAVVFSIPFAFKVLPRDEASSPGSVDLVGGTLLALAVIGVLLTPTEGSRSGWTSIGVIAGISLVIVGDRWRRKLLRKTNRDCGRRANQPSDGRCHGYRHRVRH